MPGLELCTFTPPDRLKDERAFEAYSIRIYEDLPCVVEFLQVLRNGQCVYAQQGHRFRIGSSYGDPGEFDPIPVGQDITGDGEPNLVVTEWSGGNACCVTFFVFSIGTQFQVLSQLVTNVDEQSHFADLDGDRNWEFVTTDWTYMDTRMDREVELPVVLRFDGGAYRLAYDLMRRPAPSQDELDSQAQQIRDLEWGSWRQRKALESFLRSLVYSGHAEMVSPFLDMVWPASDPGKAEYLEWFAYSFSESPYWPEIRYLSAEWPWPVE